MSTSLQGIAQKAKTSPTHRFQALYELLDEEMLHDCWRDIRKDAAYGVDKVSAYEYEQDLDANITHLVQRLKEKRYRAKLVRRTYIPKDEQRMRPLGIPAVEDKLLQIAVKRILEAIYEQDFFRCSYGYRPGVGAHDAIDKLTVKLQFGRYNVVVDADIKGYFDNIDHDWLVRMLKQRIDDGPFIRLIQKWLSAGVLDTDGTVKHPVTGTPQGGIVSPVLANVYLHYVLDLWCQKIVKRHCRGEACLIRYADDFVCAFQYHDDAERFYRALGNRLEKFGLQLSQRKTQIIPFGPQQQAGSTSFDFLGFEFRWGTDRSGKPHLKRRTARKNLRASLKRMTTWIKENRDTPLQLLFYQLNAKLRGYYNYYGIIGNAPSLKQFFEQALQLLLKWLNRNSQRRSYNWDGFKQLIDHFNIEQPRITERRRARRVSFT